MRRHARTPTSIGLVHTFRSLVSVDARSAGRDSLLRAVPLIPFGLALLIRAGVPALQGMLTRAYGFDLAPYYPLIMGFFVLTIPGFVGFLVGFLLLDERDDRTLVSLLVSPLPLRRYLAYRLGAPLVLGTSVTLVTYPLAGIAPLPILPLLVVAILASGTAALLALTLAGFAGNKVAGFALLKGINSVTIFPVLAYFVPEPFQWIAGAVPTYWPMKALWLALEREPYGWTVVAGVVVSGIYLLVLFRRFQSVLRRS